MVLCQYQPTATIANNCEEEEDIRSEKANLREKEGNKPLNLKIYVEVNFYLFCKKRWPSSQA